MPTIAQVSRQCPKCRETLTLTGAEAQDGRVIRCPICKKQLRVTLVGIFNRHIELEGMGIFG